MKFRYLIPCLLVFAFSNSDVKAEGKPTANLDEDQVGNLPIPDVLTCENGSKITTKEEWLAKRKPELMSLFEKEEYGKTPALGNQTFRFVLKREDREALGGKAVKREVTAYLSGKENPRAELLIYLPKIHKKPAPCFISLNFAGNHAVTDDPSISLAKGWFRNDPAKGYVDNKATEKSRASSTERWPIAEIIARGYAVCTAYYGDFEPDRPDGLADGVRFQYLKGGQKECEPGEWGAIGAWAWGMSRMADYLQTTVEVDGKKLVALGHSRLGKTAVWAGAQDERFGIVISNDSGAGGAALHKRIFGETVAALNKNFPHWFNGNFKRYSENERALPIDQHELIALMAPRPVYIASATEDLWADPKGEFLGGKLAEPVYALFGKKGLGVDAPPEPDKSVGDFIGYHSRTGKHNILLFDWQQYMNFADKHWGKPQ
jgi:hypothetical protein